MVLENPTLEETEPVPNVLKYIIKPAQNDNSLKILFLQWWGCIVGGWGV
jgi:hypothetical protein